MHQASSCVRGQHTPPPPPSSPPRHASHRLKPGCQRTRRTRQGLLQPGEGLYRLTAAPRWVISHPETLTRRQPLSHRLPCLTHREETRREEMGRMGWGDGTEETGRDGTIAGCHTGFSLPHTDRGEWRRDRTGRDGSDETPLGDG